MPLPFGFASKRYASFVSERSHEASITHVLAPIGITQLSGRMRAPEGALARQILPFHVLPVAQLVITVFVLSTVLPFLRLNTVAGYATHTANGVGGFAVLERTTPVFTSTSWGFVAFVVVHVAFTVQVLAPLAIVQLGGTVSVPVIGAVPTVIVTDCNGVVCPFPVH